MPIHHALGDSRRGKHRASRKKSASAKVPDWASWSTTCEVTVVNKKTGKKRVIQTVGSARDYRNFQLGQKTRIQDDEESKPRKVLSRADKRIKECKQLLRSLCGVKMPERAESAGTLQVQAAREAALKRHRTPRTSKQLGQWIDTVAPRVANPDE